MELVPEENKELEDKLFHFERALDKECHIYGWGRGLRKATQLYKDNIVLESELEECNSKIEAYQKLVERLKTELESKSPKIVYDPLQCITTPDILTPIDLTPVTSSLK
tara:strand:+ start:452 stop:775 length:324 start_codon:yes stop_codon:yes gene_type:complete